MISTYHPIEGENVYKVVVWGYCLEHLTKMQLLSSFLLLAVATACNAAGPSLGQIKNLVTFGDSYTDVVST